MGCRGLVLLVPMHMIKSTQTKYVAEPKSMPALNGTYITYPNLVESSVLL